MPCDKLKRLNADFSFKRRLKRHIRFENDTKMVRKRRLGQKKIGGATVLISTQTKFVH